MLCNYHYYHINKKGHCIADYGIKVSNLKAYYFIQKLSHNVIDADATMNKPKLYMNK